ncbi:hypothetical protein Cva_00840 [Caedimonas varicaedens]|uniref:Uncharacterized protein n=1 Tax=Caedimonas varicaedens TaxID=1629334 RepID=A0A0K8MCJ7_9PROT|nr:hypothetical protein Cva_00840 [Caedimonas varicaedens]
MKFLKDILGITSLEDQIKGMHRQLRGKIEEVYQQSKSANAGTHSALFEQKEMLDKICEVFVPSDEETPQIFSNREVKQSQKNLRHIEGSCTLKKDVSQYKTIVNYLKTRESASVDQIYQAVKKHILTKNVRGKKQALRSALSRLKIFGFVKKVKYGVYQIVERKNV